MTTTPNYLEDDRTGRSRSAASHRHTTSQSTSTAFRHTPSPSSALSLGTSQSSKDSTKKRKWFQRLSASVQSLNASTNTSTLPKEVSTTDTADLSNRFSTLGFNTHPQSNKLVKRSHSRKEPLQEPSSSSDQSRRASTFGPSRSRGSKRISLFASIVLGSSQAPPPSDLHHHNMPEKQLTSEPVSVWRLYFQSKQDNAGDRRDEDTVPTIRQIYPNPHYCPTLLTAIHVTPSISNNTSSVSINCSDYSHGQTRPISPDDLFRKNSTRRSMSISRMLSSSIRFGRGASKSKRRRFSPLSVDRQHSPVMRMHSSIPDERAEVTQDSRSGAIPTSAPMIRTVSDNDSFHSFHSFQDGDDANLRLHQDMQVDEQPSDFHAALSDVSRPRQHSILPSERASTLIGSDDNDMDFQSDTVFDSLRTRASPIQTPHAETIFAQKSDLACSPPSSPIYDPAISNSPFGRHTERFESYKTSTSLQNRLPIISLSAATTALLETDEEWDQGLEPGKWSTEWKNSSTPQMENDDQSLKRNSDVSEHKSSTFPRRKTQKRLTGGLDIFPKSTATSSTPSAYEDPDTNMLDWDVDDSPNSSPDSALKDEEPESPTQVYRSRRRAPSMHVRSKSMPAAGKYLLSKSPPLCCTPAAYNYVLIDPSENWDDDFDDCFGGGDVVVPRAIKDAQVTVMTHLEDIKAFALQVENMKKLCAQADSDGARFGQSASLWEEADSIIAFATINDDEPLTAPYTGHSTPNMDGFDDFSANNSDENLVLTRKQRRTSVLLLEDDIFGGIGDTSADSIDIGIIAKARTTTTKKSLAAKQQLLTPIPADSVDPVSAAKTLMSRIQQRNKSDNAIHTRISSSPSRKIIMKEQKMHFDTSTLAELLKHAECLNAKLEKALHVDSQLHHDKIDKDTMLPHDLSDFQDWDKTPKRDRSVEFENGNIPSTPNKSSRPKSKTPKHRLLSHTKETTLSTRNISPTATSVA